MAYYVTLFSPETYRAFSKTNRKIIGFGERKLSLVKKLERSDKLVCYVTKRSVWVGLLEVAGNYFIDDPPIFYPKEDPFTLRLKVKPIVWLSGKEAIHIYEEEVWNTLTFTRGHDGHSGT